MLCISVHTFKTSEANAEPIRLSDPMQLNEIALAGNDYRD